jgi:hypothetical protein
VKAGSLCIASAVIGGFGLDAWALMARVGRDLDEGWGFGEPFVPELAATRLNRRGGGCDAQLPEVAQSHSHHDRDAR